MKKNNLLLIALGVMLSMSSCSSWKYQDFSQRKYMKKFHVSKFETSVVAREKVSTDEITTQPLVASLPVQVSAEPKIENQLRTLPKARAIVHSNPAPIALQELPVFRTKKKAEKNSPSFKHLAKLSHHYQMAAEEIVEILLAIFLPPIAVILHDDGVHSSFWICLILTLLLWLPGAIYALLYVTDSIH